MFYTEITETTCKTVRFSGIYGLYVNNGAQKTYFFGFGYWRPRVRVPPLRPKSKGLSSKTVLFLIFSGVRTKVLRRLANIVCYSAVRMRRMTQYTASGMRLQMRSLNSVFPSGASRLKTFQRSSRFRK